MSTFQPRYYFFLSQFLVLEAPEKMPPPPKPFNELE